MAVPKLTIKALTNKIRELGMEAITIDDSGTPITRNDVLARMLWDKALGSVEKVRDSNGNLKEITHAPDLRVAEFLYERQEGKVPQAVSEDETRIRAVDKVRELSKDRLNKLAGVAAGPPKFVPPKG